MTIAINYRYHDENKRSLRALFVLLANSLKEQSLLPKDKADLEKFKSFANRARREMPIDPATAFAASVMDDGINQSLQRVDAEIEAVDEKLARSKRDFDLILERLDAEGETWFNRSFTVKSAPVGPFVENGIVKTDEMKKALTEVLSSELPEHSFEILPYREKDKEPRTHTYGETINEFEITFSSIHEDRVIRALGNYVSEVLRDCPDIKESEKEAICHDEKDGIRTVTDANGVAITRALGFEIDGVRGSISYYLGKYANLDMLMESGLDSVANPQAPYLHVDNYKRDEQLVKFFEDGFGGPIGRTMEGFQKAMVRLTNLYLNDHGHEFNIDKLKQSLRQSEKEVTQTLDH